jgi:hypothetical protein
MDELNVDELLQTSISKPHHVCRKYSWGSEIIASFAWIHYAQDFIADQLRRDPTLVLILVTKEES